MAGTSVQLESKRCQPEAPGAPTDASMKRCVSSSDVSDDSTDESVACPTEVHLIKEEQTNQNAEDVVMMDDESMALPSKSSVNDNAASDDAALSESDVTRVSEPMNCTPIVVKIGDDNVTVEGTDVNLTKMLIAIAEDNETLYNFILKKEPFHRHLMERSLHVSNWHEIWQIIYRSGTDKGGDLVAAAGLYLLGKEYVRSLWCTHCKSMFKGNPEDFEIHVKETHGGQLVLLPCDFCGEFFQAVQYTAHWTRHFFQHCCDMCNRHFQSANRLQKHKVVHQKGQPYSCRYCNVKMKNKCSINQHERLHFEEPKSARQELCHVCGKIYTCARVIHMNTHNEGRAFVCQICGRKYKSQYILNCHYRIKHSEQQNKEIKYEICDQCGKRLKASALHQHMRRHRKDLTYECAACGKKFYEESKLRGHMLKHSDERNFECEVCGKAFKSRRYLKIHTMVHSDEKNFTCPLCGKKIRMSSNYYTHLKVHRNRGEVVPSKEILEH